MDILKKNYKFIKKYLTKGTNVLICGKQNIYVKYTINNKQQ